MKNRKKCKQIGTLADYVKANRKASREEEILAHGKQVSSRPAVFKSKKVYNRKRRQMDIPYGED
ncbi:MAG: hypothetical protein J6V95_00270 [Bacteroidaceae bacterium]|nr:hypothetical protein [Bacteroidaceae bacterium]